MFLAEDGEGGRQMMLAAVGACRCQCKAPVADSKALIPARERLRVLARREKATPPKNVIVKGCINNALAAVVRWSDYLTNLTNREALDR